MKEREIELERDRDSEREGDLALNLKGTQRQYLISFRATVAVPRARPGVSSEAPVGDSEQLGEDSGGHPIPLYRMDPRLQGPRR